MDKPTRAARARARRFALQALYQMQLTGTSALEVERQFLQDYDMKRVDKAYLHDLLTGIDREAAALEQIFAPRLDRPAAELDPVARAALLIGCFEIVHRIDIPWRVAINEGIELAKQFGGEDSYKLINSVLDDVSAEYRQVERAAFRNR